jgi:hypothetical protein
VVVPRLFTWPEAGPLGRASGLAVSLNRAGAILLSRSRFTFGQYESGRYHLELNGTNLAPRQAGPVYKDVDSVIRFDVIGDACSAKD